MTVVSAWRRRKGWDPAPQKFHDLAIYNAEVYRGIVHTPEYDERMAKVQAEFNDWAEDQRRKDGYVKIEEFEGGTLWQRA